MLIKKLIDLEKGQILLIKEEIPIFTDTIVNIFYKVKYKDNWYKNFQSFEEAHNFLENPENKKNYVCKCTKDEVYWIEKYYLN